MTEVEHIYIDDSHPDEAERYYGAVATLTVLTVCIEDNFHGVLIFVIDLAEFPLT